ncbi:inverse autotransporter beta domain-containing protein [Xenorhabdus sp. PB62.4]|uniref:inverse autotransporter beta domain-containing protein n=1 Tax=Xenorhabdus sp. PB62.4 TaxID=1851573 RepID=UPI001656EEC6|nr:inverse autotransporter beta domain-containing protein [Xenorhabdus sp. PB62.4]MBC8953254.1 putative invasin [Xenorhabdus sp. PB62.4]
MSSYISKIIGFFVVICTLLIPSTMIHALTEGKVIDERPKTQKENIGLLVKESSKKFLDSKNNKENNLQKKLEASEDNISDTITSNIQNAGNILSSSPSELAEQAKSYALGKFNNMVSSEAQKWLSQFGSARINFGLDKKGSLENNSLDLLIPLYDNKTDWLFFSQLGYRHKDSRNTINAGLGGRYFYQNWMYGLNTFYDHDITGKNQRLGLGGEIWSDYIKLSANTYYRLSDWQKSRNVKDHYERPANGYDINGEFFLPAYPNLGAKLSYEQYFGENVALFNRDTKQKNPSLAKVGLTYTPIPLVTMGMDYKQGESGHTETQFLANLNYKLGVPLDVQLSPENVASMRTLAGSRYDLVERNNNIVLDHQEMSVAQLSLPETITGYSQEQHDITAKFSSNTPIKQIHWTTSKDFEHYGGKLTPNVSSTIKIILPKYLSGENQNNNYPIYAVAELENNRKLAPVQMNVVVRPFMVKKREEANFTPTGPLPDTGNKEDGYTFNPVITFDTENGAPIKNVTINDVKWITDPPIGSNSGLQFIDWGNPTSIEVDENGQFKHKLVLVSSKIQKDVKVYLQMDGQPQQLVGQVSFNGKPANYHVEKVDIYPDGPLTADGNKAYIYTAVIKDQHGNHVKNQPIPNAEWKIEEPQDHDGLKLHPSNTSTATGPDGKLQITLTSTKEHNGVLVSLSIGENGKPVLAKPVEFIKEKLKITLDHQNPNNSELNNALVNDVLIYTVTVKGDNNKFESGKKVKWDFVPVKGVKFLSTTETTDGYGQATAILTSTEKAEAVVVSATVDGQTEPHKQGGVNFDWPTIDMQVSGNNVIAGSQDKYTFTATVYRDKAKTKKYTGPNTDKGTAIKFIWMSVPDGTTLGTPAGEELSVHPDGTLTNTLSGGLNKGEVVQNITACLKVAGSNGDKTCASPVSFYADVEIDDIKVTTSSGKEVPAGGKSSDYLEGNGNDYYVYTAKVINKVTGNALPDGYTFEGDIWNSDPVSETNKNNGIPELKFLRKDTKVTNGELVAHLVSGVGVGDFDKPSGKLMDGVKVTLTLPSSVKGKPPISLPAEVVAFNPKPQVAGLEAFNVYNPSVKRVFTEQNRPYNSFSTLRGRLVKLPSTAPILQRGDKIDNIYRSSDGVLVDNENEGILNLMDTTPAFVKITVKSPNKAKYLYTYQFGGKKFFTLSGTLHADTISSNVTCVDGNEPGLRDITRNDLTDQQGDEIPLATEFPNSYSWGLLNVGDSSTPPTDTTNILAGGGEPFLYDAQSDKYAVRDHTEGYLVCVAKSF